MKYFRSLKSEWLKTRRSASSWLCLIGGSLVPVIWFFVFLKEHKSINAYEIDIWKKHFMKLWQNMAMFLLPFGIILASSLITQIESKNNTWKQLHTSPQSYTTIFFSKFSVIILLTAKFFIFFNIGILLSAIIPSLLYDHELPKESIPILFFFKWNIKFFIVCLPVIAIQYLFSLNFKNSIIPIGFGFVLLIGTLIGIQWKYILFSPYCFSALNMMPMKNKIINIFIASGLHFIFIMIISFMLYIKRKEKG